jgi:hypothetical protein
VMFNRFIPTGLGAIHQREIGVPTETELLSALTEGHELAREYGMTIMLGVPIEASPEMQSRFHGIDWASCPVERGQRAWTIGPDLQIRRCSSFEWGIGSLRDKGLQRLLTEMNAGPTSGRGNQSVLPCHILGGSRLVQIGGALA